MLLILFKSVGTFALEKKKLIATVTLSLLLLQHMVHIWRLLSLCDGMHAIYSG